MGLDMYLHKKTYVKNWSHTKPEERHEVSVKKNGQPVVGIKPERISEISETVGQWRKFNALHRWFVENCQNGEDDCKEYHVDRSQLVNLLGVLKQVQEDFDTTGGIKAHELFPTESGPFFGDTSYDEYYFDDVKETVVLLEELIQEDGDGYFYYQSSW
jgi:hypothetical protein